MTEITHQTLDMIEGNLNLVNRVIVSNDEMRAIIELARSALTPSPSRESGLEEAIRRAEPFITCNSGDGNYSVNFKCRSLKDAQDLHTAVIRALTGKGGE